MKGADNAEGEKNMRDNFLFFFFFKKKKEAEKKDYGGK